MHRASQSVPPGELLRLAASRDDLVAATVILQRHKKEKSVIDSPDTFGTTPLHIACNHGNIAVVTRLVEEGANVNASDNFGQTPLINAAFNGFVEIVKFLVENRADVNKSSIFGQTALTKSSYAGRQDVVTYLLSVKVNVDAQTEEGKTALMVAAENGHLKICSLLHEIGKADLNARSKEGYSAMMLAAEAGVFVVVTYLARIGADITILNKAGKSVLQIPAKTTADKSVEQVKDAVNKGQKLKSAPLLDTVGLAADADALPSSQRARPLSNRSPAPVMIVAASASSSAPASKQSSSLKGSSLDSKEERKHNGVQRK